MEHSNTSGGGRPASCDSRDLGISKETRFRLATGTPRAMGAQNAARFIPSQGAFILDGAGGGRRIRLGPKLGEGGEGAVFATDCDLVCKTYVGARLTKGLREKLTLMISNPFEHRAICWPQSLALSERGELVGYLMPKAQGKELQRTVFIKPLLRAAFPHWTRVELVTLAITILEAMLALHERNVIIGDINPLNILVANEREVFFVDCDSYQIEDFACPVGTPTFLTPELLGTKLGDVLRSFSHEHFAVATLVFMILVPGKPPYSHAGGGDPAENVRRRHFPYALEKKGSVKVPAGPWRFIWSHLPLYMKRMFHGVFASGAEITTSEWIARLRQYACDLECGHLSKEIFPTNLKPLTRQAVLRNGGSWTKCRQCGDEFGTFDKGLDVCRACGASEAEVRCFLCGRTFQIRMGQLARLAGRDPLCEPCRQSRLPVHCRDCGKGFEITGGERAYFRRKGFALPIRCKECRRRRRGALQPGPASPTGSFGAAAPLARALPGGLLGTLQRRLNQW